MGIMTGRSQTLLRSLIICCLLLLTTKTAKASVTMNVKFLNFSNPDGYSWNRLDYNGARRPCDNGKDNNCDTYLLFCLQIKGYCEINALAERGNKHYADQNNINHLSSDYHWEHTFNSWSGGNVKLFINPYDDDGYSDDLIDIIYTNVLLTPGTPEAPKIYPLHFHNHTSLYMEIRIWCTEAGHFGIGCTQFCPENNPFIACNAAGEQTMVCNGLDPSFTSSLTKQQYYTRSCEDLTCKTTNIEYGIECSMCGLLYVGETKGQLNQE